MQAVGGELQVQPSGSTTSLDQMRTEVRGRVTAVQQSAASPDSALSAVPAEADPELAAARPELQTASQRAQSAVEQLGAAVGKVADAGTAAEAAAGLPGLKAALTGTANDLQAYLESLRTTVNGGEEAIRSSFGAAPACKDVAATP
jgi:phage shock protein A